LVDYFLWILQLEFDDVKTNELHFVSMILISWDKVNLQQLLLGLFKLQFVFHDQHVRLMFSFVQVMLYIAMGKAFMGWASIPPYSFVTTN
jgi:ABC-type iron transport system FetAB permease component